MKDPICCGMYMLDLTLSYSDTRSKRVWSCERCGRTKLWGYAWRIPGLILTARNTVIIDESIKIPWWLGSMGGLRALLSNEVHFVVIPFNIIIDAAISVWHWFRFRKPDHWSEALEAAARLGSSYGRGVSNVYFKSVATYQLKEGVSKNPGDMIAASEIEVVDAPED